MKYYDKVPEKNPEKLCYAAQTFLFWAYFESLKLVERS